MKICFISETLAAGVGRHIAEITVALAARGHEIHLIHGSLRCEERHLAVIKSCSDIPCLSLPMPHGISARDTAIFGRIRRYVLDHGPFDILHGHSSKGGAYARLLALLEATPVIYTPHAFITNARHVPAAAKAFYRIVEGMLARITDVIVCTSRAEYSHGRGLGIAPSRLTVVANGTDVDGEPREAARTALGVGSEAVILGFVGRMDEQKAPDRVIAAARELLPDLPEAVVVMVGDGPKRAALEADMRGHPANDRILWLGDVEARDFMAGFDVLVMSSRYEGFAYVMIEALHFGLPIVTTRVGGIDEAVDDGVNGIIVQSETPSELASAIRHLAMDVSLRRTMAARSRQRATRFSLDRLVDDLEAVYAQTARRAHSATFALPGTRFAQAGASPLARAHDVAAAYGTPGGETKDRFMVRRTNR